MISPDPYYSRAEVSNSDLVALKMYFMPRQQVLDLTEAFRFGDLIDKMITEPSRVDHTRMMIDGMQYSQEEWQKAYSMLKAFRNDSFCKQFLSMCSGQKEFYREQFQIDMGGFKFSLPVRCKYDLWGNAMGYGGDIKSTVATTQKQFEEAFYHFDYDQSRAWYMDISEAKRDVVIGISKKEPHKIFKLFIDRDSAIYKSGKEKYTEGAFRHWTLFEELEVAA